MSHSDLKKFITSNLTILKVIFIFNLEIQKIQKLYLKYDNIITDLDYDFINDTVYIRNKGKINLNYVKFLFNFQKSSSIGNQERIKAVEGNDLRENLNTNRNNNFLPERKSSRDLKDEIANINEKHLEFSNDREMEPNAKLYLPDDRLQNIDQIKEIENEISHSASSFTNNSKSSIVHDSIDKFSSNKFHNDVNLSNPLSSVKNDMDPTDQIEEDIN